MNKLLLVTAFITSTGLMSAEAADNNGSARIANAHAWGVIDTQALKALMDTNTDMLILDARGDQWFDGFLIPGAQRLDADASPLKVRQVIPGANQLIIVYCAGEGCPASKNLARRLIKEGYNNVIDYHEGLRQWKAANYPVHKLEK